MMLYRIMFLTLLFFSSIQNGSGQKRLLVDQVVLSDIRVCISSTYGMEFDKAREAVIKIEKYSPDHPAVKFLKAFILYWEYYPIVPGHPKEKDFLHELEQCIRISEEWVKKSPDELEAIFFDLFSRAFYVMYFADNGKQGKVFPHLNILYQHTIEGFSLKEKFNEFYFTTGLYNYYIEAFPEKHPVYKPMVLFFREGDRVLGKEQLEYCAENSIFLRVEARFFLSILYLNYESNLLKASQNAAKLYSEFPNNPLYAGKYLEMLLFNKKYFFAPVILEKLKSWDDPFSQMQYYLYHAYYLEKAENKQEQAKKEYRKALELSVQFNDFTDVYNAIAWMGLSRYYEKNGNVPLANRFFRQARSATSYDYILDDR